MSISKRCVNYETWIKFLKSTSFWNWSTYGCTYYIFYGGIYYWLFQTTTIPRPGIVLPAERRVFIKFSKWGIERPSSSTFGADDSCIWRFRTTVGRWRRYEFQFSNTISILFVLSFDVKKFSVVARSCLVPPSGCVPLKVFESVILRLILLRCVMASHRNMKLKELRVFLCLRTYILELCYPACMWLIAIGRRH